MKKFSNLIFIASSSLVFLLPFRKAGAQSDGVTLRYTGSEGSIDYRWTPPSSDSDGGLGAIAVHATLGGKESTLQLAPFLRAASDRLHFDGWGRTGAGQDVVLRFSNKGTAVKVAMRFHLEGKTLLSDVEADHAIIARMNTGPLKTTAATKELPVPYYSGKPLLLPEANLFANVSLDWTASHATTQNGPEATYEPLTNGSRNPLEERILLTVSTALADILPPIDNPASPYISQLAGATVFDIWNQQRFSEITQAFTSLAEYRKKNCVVVIHVWQREGYDNALPSHFPANATQGGDVELKKAVAAAQSVGCRVGLHQNYVDDYPNSEAFTKQAIALNSDGTPKKAWYNGVTHVQSFATKPTWFVKNAREQVAGIHERYGTSASFLDVNSASFPWFRTDMEAGQNQAGMFAATVDANRALWALQRTANNGPAFGEGLNHWYWSGLLDGVEAQPGVGFGPKGENTPLFVDFDLLRIHPLQVNHGMGMYARWTSNGREFFDVLPADAYRMQEIVYGHAPFVGGDAWHNRMRTLIEEELVGPVAARYGTQKVRKIEYQTGGKWVDPSTAARAGDWSRVAVEYENGDRITVNAKSDSLRVEDRDLPQYGWFAKGKDLLAYTAIYDGVIRDYAQTANSYFANARNQDDVEGSAATAAPSVKSFSQTGNRTGVMQIGWNVLEGARGTDLATFVHFVDATGKIRFQGDYTDRQPTSLWRSGQVILGDPFQVRIPQDAQDGTYQIRVGLYSPAAGTRFHLRGLADNEGRFILGDLVVSNGGRNLQFRPVQPNSQHDARLNGTGRTLDFQTIQTDGMVMLDRDKDVWTLQTYPSYRDVLVKLSAREFPLPATVECSAGARSQSPQVVSGYWQVHAKGARSCWWRSSSTGH